MIVLFEEDVQMPLKREVFDGHLATVTDTA